MVKFDDIIGGFYRTIKDRYPDLTEQQVSAIIRTPFIFLAKQMAKPTLPTVRFKYWGSFVPKLSRLDKIVKRRLEGSEPVRRPEKTMKINTILQIHGKI